MSKVHISKKTLVGLQELANLSPQKFPSLSLSDAISATLVMEARELVVKQTKKGLLKNRMKSTSAKIDPAISMSSNLRVANRIGNGDQIQKKSGSRTPGIER
jgi:hypothetical protein